MKYSSYSFPLAQYSPTRYSGYTSPSSTYTPSAVSSYSAATHYTPSSHYTPTHYSSSSLSSSTASKYLPSSYTSSYTPSLYTPVAHKSLSSYTSLSSYVKPPRYTSAREASTETRQTSARRASSTRATEARQTSARRSSIKSTAAPTSVAAAAADATATAGAAPDATATDPDASPQVVVKPVRNVRFPNDIIFQDFVRHGDLEQIGRFMRARKVRLDKFFLSGMAALHEAVLSGNLECVKLLVFYGADVHQRDEDGWTPLHMACSDSFPEIAKYLISKGARTEAANANGDRPADLIDPECKELVEMFKVGCV
ncbi:uncharacterized protein ppp1r27a [Alosa pseudoharengus]|uniref:uncharacterized protein ppp1r27a n=1 Tax=Alosa pseudoharengus TaxID=34774 RepID=UPI003F8CB0A5